MPEKEPSLRVGAGLDVVAVAEKPRNVLRALQKQPQRSRRDGTASGRPKGARKVTAHQDHPAPLTERRVKVLGPADVEPREEVGVARPVQQAVAGEVA